MIFSDLTGGEFGAGVAAILTAIGTVLVTLWKYVVSPAVKTLKDSISSIEQNYEGKMKLVRDELNIMRSEYEQKIRELRSDYEEKITILEARHSVQMEKMDEALSHCHKEREEAILWKARYEYRIHELERATLEGRITAVSDDQGVSRIVTANIAAFKMFGYTRSEMLGMPVEELISPEFRERHRNRMASHTPEVFKEFNRIINGGMGIRKDGTKFPVTVEVDSTLVNGRPGWSAIITLE